MKKGIILSVIVCTYNRADLLKECLSSLTKQSISKGAYEVLIVDNNSNDLTKNLSLGFVNKNDNFHYFLEKRQGLSFARNRGICEAKGEFIAYIDDDAKAGFNWCENIVNAFINIKPAPIIVGGKILPYYKKKPPIWFDDVFEVRDWGTEPRFLKENETLSGSNMSFKKDIITEFNGFDTNFGMNGKTLGFGEETELMRRILAKYTGIWYDPKIEVLHYTPESNMKVKYRLKRSYKSGETYQSIMEISFLKAIFKFFIAIFIYPFILITGKEKFLAKIIIWFSKIAVGLGMVNSSIKGKTN